MNNSNFKSELPYPPIRILQPNKYYACILMEDYAGRVSEMTAINQYLYHYFDNKNNYKDIAKELEEIAIVEMHHLEILAQLITLLGEKPIYYSQNSFWNGSYVAYGVCLLEQLQSDLASEYQAIENYQKDLLIINDPYIQAIIKRIILDEEVHVKIFINLINKVSNNWM